MEDVVEKENSDTEELQNGDASSPPLCADERWYRRFELVLITYAPMMMMCQLLMHFYVDSRIGEIYFLNPKMGYPSSYKKHTNMLPTLHNVQQHTTLWMTDILTVESFLSVFSIYAIHLLNEVYGRKVGMLVSLSGTMVKFILITVTIKFKLPLDVLCLASAINGITGGAASFITSVVSHISDTDYCYGCSYTIITKTQSYAIGISGVVMIFFGYIMKYSDFFTSSLVLLVWAALNIFVILFLLKKSQQKKIDWKNLQIFSLFKDLWNVESFRKYYIFFFFLSATSVRFFPIGGQSPFLIQFLINRPFNFSTLSTGLYLSLIALTCLCRRLYTNMLIMENVSCSKVTSTCLAVGFMCSIVLSITNAEISIEIVLTNNLVGHILIYFLIREMVLDLNASMIGYLYASLFTINAIGTSLLLPLLNAIYVEMFTVFPGAVFFPYATLFLITTTYQLLLQGFDDDDNKRLKEV